MSDKRPPVRVRLLVETGFPGAEHEDVIEFDRDEWEAMSSDEQEASCDEALTDYTGSCIGTSYTVLDDEEAGEDR